MIQLATNGQIGTTSSLRRPDPLAFVLGQDLGVTEDDARTGERIVDEPGSLAIDGGYELAILGNVAYGYPGHRIDGTVGGQ